MDTCIDLSFCASGAPERQAGLLAGERDQGDVGGQENQIFGPSHAEQQAVEWIGARGGHVCRPYPKTELPIREYDVTPEGRRFLLLHEDRPAIKVTEMIVVQNWVDELRRRVPTK